MNKKGAGSHNRNTEYAIKHLQKSINLKKECKCPLHKRKHGEGEYIDQVRFNRQGENGIQSMCRDGKKRIDSLKHCFWRAISLVLLKAIENGTIYTKEYNELKKISLSLVLLKAIENGTICNKEYNELKEIPFFSNFMIKSIINGIFNHKIILNYEKCLKEGLLDAQIYFETSKFLENNLTLKKIGIYDIFFDNENRAIEVYDKILKKMQCLTEVKKLNNIGFNLINLINEDFYNFYFVKESSDKNNKKYYEVTNMQFNWSKMNDLYQKNENGDFVKTNYRGPFHNTKKKYIGSSDRIVKYLVEVDSRPNSGIKETNSFINSGKTENVQADHIWPLAMGGKHTKENIAFISKEENLLKKDHITYNAYCKIVENISSIMQMINKDFVSSVLNFYENVGLNQEEFNKKIYSFELELKKLMKDRQDNFEKMNYNEKIDFLGKIRKDLSKDKADNFIERYKRQIK